SSLSLFASLSTTAHRFRVTLFPYTTLFRSYSAAVSLTTPGFPDQPTGLTSTASTANSITLQWSDVASETSYVIQRSSDNTTWSTIATLQANTIIYLDTRMTEATLYYYRVIA